VKAVDEIQDFVSKIYKNFEAKITWIIFQETVMVC
jgi:hypothetical protein